MGGKVKVLHLIQWDHPSASSERRTHRTECGAYVPARELAVNVAHVNCLECLKVIERAGYVIRHQETQERRQPMKVVIVPNDRGNPPGKLADAELRFEDGPLAGLKLIGFQVWERRGGNGVRNVTFPARQYAVSGERRSFALLRPISDNASLDPIKEAILKAFEEYEQQAAVSA